MASIFISYAREQKPFAAELAKDLIAGRHTVWWDHEMNAGEDFDRYIRDRITAAEAVVVIWSDEAAASAYVRGEARSALRLEKLVPVAISGFDFTNLPPDFQSYHTVGLDDRPAILRAVTAKIGKPHPIPAPTKKPSTKTSNAKRPPVQPQGLQATQITEHTQAVDLSSPVGQKPGQDNQILEAERLNWKRIKPLNNIQEIRAHLDKFPDGETAKIAQMALDMLGDVAVFSRDMTSAAPEEILEDCANGVGHARRCRGVLARHDERCA
jgi:hypothetical protein